MPSDVKVWAIPGAARARLALPLAWRVASLGNDPVAEARRLAASWSTLRDNQVAADQFSRGVASTLREAASSGATFAAMMAGDGDVPVAASLVAADLGDAVHTPASIELTWRSIGRTPRRHSLPVGPSVIDERVVETDIDPTMPASSYQLQVAIPHPERSGLLLTFSSPLVPIADQLRTVALAIAATIRWTSSKRN